MGTGQFPAVLKLLSKTSNVLTSSNTVNTTKNSNWRRIDEWDWNNSRRMFSTEQETLLQYTNIPAMSCPEIVIDGEDMKAYEKVMMNAPGNKYAKGFNVEAGDQGVLFKM